MTISIFPISRLSRMAALVAATLAALAVALAFATGASARRSACTSSSHPSVRVCARSHRRHKASHAKRHGKRHTKTSPGGPAADAGKVVPPVCEDGTNAVSSGGGPRCDDGSEPQCALDTTPVLTAGGKLLFCRPEAEVASSFDEVCAADGREAGECTSAPAPSDEATSACDDGSEALADVEGAFVCGDGTEPRCPEPAALTLSETGASLVCEPAEEAA